MAVVLADLCVHRDIVRFDTEVLAGQIGLVGPHLPLQGTLQAQRRQEELGKAVEGTLQPSRGHLKVIVGGLLSEGDMGLGFNRDWGTRGSAYKGCGSHLNQNYLLL